MRAALVLAALACLALAPSVPLALALVGAAACCADTARYLRTRNN